MFWVFGCLPPNAVAQFCIKHARPRVIVGCNTMENAHGRASGKRPMYVCARFSGAFVFLFVSCFFVVAAARDAGGGSIYS